ncbi:MAG: MFS transporter [Candidatus Omnitrophota bacterium]
MKKAGKLVIVSWALYDLANQFFALNVVSLYFVRWLTLEKGAPEILYSVFFGISTLFVALFAPVLGAVSDAAGRRMPFLLYCTLLSISFTMLLGLAGNIFLGLAFFAIANFGCQMGIVFYNALLADIAPRRKLGLISGLGRMFGYGGAIVTLLITKPIILKSGYQAVFLPTGFFFLLFSLPCILFVKDAAPRPVRVSALSFFNKESFVTFLKNIRSIIFSAQEFPYLSNFLKASFFALCGINAVILFMSIYATKVFALGESQIIDLVAFSALFAIVGSFISGFISDYIGHKRTLFAVFIMWIACFTCGAFARNFTLYWVVGALVGLALGATWTVSRALAVKIAPPERLGEIFGLFNFAGYLAAIVGPLFWSLVLLIAGSFGAKGYRLALLSLNLFMFVGLWFLLRIPKIKVNEFAGISNPQKI